MNMRELWIVPFKSQTCSLARRGDVVWKDLWKERGPNEVLGNIQLDDDILFKGCFHNERAFVFLAKELLRKAGRINWVNLNMIYN